MLLQVATDGVGQLCHPILAPRTRKEVAIWQLATEVTSWAIGIVQAARVCEPPSHSAGPGCVTRLNGKMLRCQVPAQEIALTLCARGLWPELGENFNFWPMLSTRASFYFPELLRRL